MDRAFIQARLDEWFERARSGEDLVDLLVGTFAADVRVHAPNGQVGGAALLREWAETVRVAIPDLAVTPQAVLIDGDRVVFQFETGGMHVGPMDFLPASHRFVSAPGAMIGRLNPEGQIAEFWFFINLGLAAIRPPDGPPRAFGVE
jgi:predicted ester cyclase